MSILLIFLTLCFLLFLFSQFGAKLSAGASVIWWLISGFLLFSVLAPYSLAPLAHLLGVQLPSNLILGGLTLFLLFLSIQEAAVSTGLGRKFREAICTLAARDFEGELRKRRPDFFTKLPHQKSALVILPTYNEEKNIEEMASRLKSLPSTVGDLLLDYCFVNDGSKDRSLALLNLHCPGHFVSHISNAGVAGVILTGFKIASNCDIDFVIQCDSDGQHPVDLIPELAKEAMSRSTDLLVGSRFVNQSRLSKHESTTRARQMGSIVLHLALSLFGGRSIVRDPTSGFRVYSTRAARALQLTMPDEYPEPESVAILQLMKLKIEEHPVAMSPRAGGESSLGGIRGIQFMIKVLTALLGLRLRTWR
jgi:hypothetical protein